MRHLSDPSLATAALNAGPSRLLRELEWMGFLFESMVVRDLRVYAQVLDGRLFYYRDNTGLEVDAVVELPDGRWAAFEVKLGSHPRVVDAAAASLLKLKSLVAGDGPVALGVITGTGDSLTRPDSVRQIAIGALRDRVSLRWASLVPTFGLSGRSQVEHRRQRATDAIVGQERYLERAGTGMA